MFIDICPTRCVHRIALIVLALPVSLPATARAQNAAQSICICKHNNFHIAWFRSKPSNWGTPNSLKIAATTCVDTGLCGSLSGTQSYVTGSYTISPTSFTSVGNLHGVVGSLSR
jgi:hypothetical protein